jgi:arginyl-tRNA synthetase
MSDPETLLNERAGRALVEAFGEFVAGDGPFVAPSSNPRFGDYQVNTAMRLGKQLRRNPREVAGEILNHLDVADVCKPPEVAGPGFINLTLTQEYLARRAAELAADTRLGIERAPKAGVTVVDYSAPNVAKEMHVGHLRSTIIGDALARGLEFLGDEVVRQNHMGDWGTQFGMLTEYLIEHGESSEELADLNELYRRASDEFNRDLDFAERARLRVVALQSGDEQTLALWRRLVQVSEEHFEAVYERLNVTLRLEDIRAESFYNPYLPTVIEDLERLGLARIADGAVCVFPQGFTRRDGEPLALIVRKSDGGYLYATTDLAAVRYRVSQLHAGRIIYVTDARQAQHFAMVFETAREAGWLPEDVSAEHVPFGTVLNEDGRPLKTRSGDTVRLADLLDEAEARAAEVVRQKNPDLTEAERREIAHAVGIGAIKYADLSTDRIKDYIFSWDRMLAMEGNTAPYLQYAYARIRSIFRNAALDPDALADAEVQIVEPEERALALKVLQLGAAVRDVARKLEPHLLCTYLFELASAFTAFYERCPVLRSEEPLRSSRLVLCALAARALKLGLGLLGIEVLERM